MSRYIDADAIDYRNDRLVKASDDFIKGVEYANSCINNAHSIDIVRCKECRLNWSVMPMTSAHTERGESDDKNDMR